MRPNLYEDRSGLWKRARNIGPVMMMRVGFPLAGLLLTMTLVLSFSGGADDAAPTVAVQADGESAPVASAPAADAAVASVAVFDFGFTDSDTGTPVTVIATGDTVSWLWTAGTHTVTHGTGSAADDLTGRAFDSGIIAVSDEDPFFAHTFSEPGVYEYYCALHLGMRGAVVVA